MKNNNKKTLTVISYPQKDQSGLGYIPSENDILNMREDYKNLYLETKEKVLAANAEAGVPAVSLDEFLKKIKDSEQFTFEHMCELWQFSAVMNFLSNPPHNLEFNC